MAIVLDTSALIEIERALAQGKKLQLPENELVILPAVVWAEALIGVRLASTALIASKRRARLEAARLNASFAPFTPEIAEHYADIYAELSSSGTMIPQNDIAVAATGRALNFPILLGSKDEAHFRRVKDLQLFVL